MIRVDTWEFYKDKAHKWRWKRKSARHNRVVEESPRSYTSLLACEENAQAAGWTGESKTKVNL